MTVFPQISNVEILPLTVIVLEGGAFGRRLGLEDEALRNGISALRRETRESSSAPYTL